MLIDQMRENKSNMKEVKMVKEKNFKLMCSEVLEILKYCPKSDVEKLPTKMINLFKQNQLEGANINIDPNKTIFEQNICEETLVTMCLIYRDYWATKEEKSELDKILKENQEKLNELYDYSNMFKNVKTEEKVSVETKKEQTEINNNLVEYKESIFSKIKKWLRNIFKRKYN